MPQKGAELQAGAAGSMPSAKRAPGGPDPSADDSAHGFQTPPALGPPTPAPGLVSLARSVRHRAVNAHGSAEFCETGSSISKILAVLAVRQPPKLLPS